MGALSFAKGITLAAQLAPLIDYAIESPCQSLQWLKNIKSEILLRALTDFEDPMPRGLFARCICLMSQSCCFGMRTVRLLPSDMCLNKNYAERFRAFSADLERYPRERCAIARAMVPQCIFVAFRFAGLAQTQGGFFISHIELVGYLLYSQQNFKTRAQDKQNWRRLVQIERKNTPVTTIAISRDPCMISGATHLYQSAIENWVLDP